MNIFLIDYENVNMNGLQGTKLLKKKDKVYIFYGVKTKSIDMEIIDSLVRSKAYFKLFKLDKIAKNALDFQLVLFLGTRIKKYGNKAKYHIISNDNGYQSSIDFAKEHLDVTINKADNIKDAIKGKSPKLLLENNPREPIDVGENGKAAKAKRKFLILEKLRADSTISSRLSENYLLPLAIVLSDNTKNYKEIVYQTVFKAVGKKYQDLIPDILECCKEFIR